MRADRLLSILLLLQNRKKITAQELAQELEVSERTIYRDIDALCVAGIPVYSQSGYGGGYGLVEDYRTQLTGLSNAELRALMTLSSFVPLSDLGMRDSLRSALLKISTALPESSRGEDQRIYRCFHFDHKWWRQTNTWRPHLQVVQEALWQERKLKIIYLTYHSQEVGYTVSPYGLVAKAGRWYLVYAREDVIFVRRISSFLDVQLSEEQFTRPDAFDLAEFWSGWCKEYEAVLADFKVTLLVEQNFIPHLRSVSGIQIEQNISDPSHQDPAGWARFKVSFESFEAARDRILSFGKGVRVIAPQALKLSVQDYAEQIVKLYQEDF
jgi:predicted DNA-binding transcriptional regulator YafY